MYSSICKIYFCFQSDGSERKAACRSSISHCYGYVGLLGLLLHTLDIFYLIFSFKFLFGSSSTHEQNRAPSSFLDTTVTLKFEINHCNFGMVMILHDYSLVSLQALPTRMDSVAGVKQKLLSNRTPQVENWLQPPTQPGLPQKPTLLVADKHWVFGALRQAGPPL